MAELKQEDVVGKEMGDWLSRPLWLAYQLDWEKVLYGVMIVLGIVSRLWDLGGRAVSHDESLHTQYAYQYYNGDGYSHTPLMHGPFLFHITALSYWLFGHNDFTARLPVALFGVILIAVPYFLRDWMGRKGALVASFIFLISPYVVYYSRYIRHDVYAIMWALIFFIATMYYLRSGSVTVNGGRGEQSLWWFSFGLAMIFATKEVSFLYVATFGSFLIYRLFLRISVEPWFRKEFGRVARPLLVVGFGILLAGVGVMGKSMLESRSEALAAEVAQGEAGAEEAAQEPVAIDPNEALPHDAEAANAEAGVLAMRWLQIAGLVALSMGLFLVANAWRPFLEQYAEFDLIILYVTLIVPSLTPLLVVMVGWDPLDYTVNQCFLQGQESMTAMQIYMARLFNGECWGIFLGSGMVRTALFLIPILIVSAAVGVWWRGKTWAVCAAIFHIAFTILFTSVFTNPAGWASGTIGSLGYWLEQQEVQRGSQPWFYYGVVMPLYEYLPLLFALAAMRLWAMKAGIMRVIRPWVWLVVGAPLLYSYVNWLYNSWYIDPVVALDPRIEPTIIPGVVATVLLVAAVVVYWVATRSRRAGTPSYRTLVENGSLTGFVPAVMWWFFLTVLAYSYAGEKMPWLSIHFVIPMAFLVGWYFEQRLADVRWGWLARREQMVLVGGVVLFVVTVVLALEPLLTGRLDFASQQQAALNLRGRFIGSMLMAIGVGVALWRYAAGLAIGLDTAVVADGKPSAPPRRAWLAQAWRLGIFVVLSLLTVRTMYMSNYANDELATEYLVYAHGAPATKNQILDKLETLSMRLHGDKSVEVVYDNEASWPFTWYLREYPNRRYVGENPSADVTNAPVMIIGNNNWNKVEPFLRDDYSYSTYTYLWWPMEEYRQISWEAVLGNPNHPTQAEMDEMMANGEVPTTLVRRGLGNADVREALWDIIFYRDYTKYGEVFNRDFNLGSWPLRDEVRLYIRNDVQAKLWDYGVGATAVIETIDPYAERELSLSASEVIGRGIFDRPRNVAVGKDGRLYVADAGNHRIAIIEDNRLIGEFGRFGTAEGELNEPWGVAVDDEFVYVADTWNHRVQKFTLDGEFVLQIGESGSIDQAQATSGGGLFFGPRDVVLLPDNQLAVTDTGNHRVQIFSREGSFVQALGGLGAQVGQFFEPVGLEVGSSGSLYVLDTWNGRVQELLPTAGYAALFEWPVEAWESQSIDNKPYMASDSAGRLYLTDPEGYQVLIFDAQGTYLGRFGQYGTDGGGFGLPNGIATDEQDNVYVVDAANGTILKFDAPFGAPAVPAVEVEDGDDEDVSPSPSASDSEDEGEGDG